MAAAAATSSAVYAGVFGAMPVRCVVLDCYWPASSARALCPAQCDLHHTCVDVSCQNDHILQPLPVHATSSGRSVLHLQYCSLLRSHVCNGSCSALHGCGPSRLPDYKVMACYAAATCHWQSLCRAVPCGCPDQCKLWTSAGCLTMQGGPCSSCHALPCRAVPDGLPDPGVLPRHGQGASSRAPGHAAPLSVSPPPASFWPEVFCGQSALLHLQG